MPPLIVVVHDDEDLSFVICLELEQAGYGSEAYCGPDAPLDFLACCKRTCQCVVLGTTMAAMPGAEVLRKMGELGWVVPVVTVSMALGGYDGSAYPGWACHVTEPFTADALRNAVGAALTLAARVPPGTFETALPALLP